MNYFTSTRYSRLLQRLTICISTLLFIFFAVDTVSAQEPDSAIPSSFSSSRIEQFNAQLKKETIVLKWKTTQAGSLNFTIQYNNNGSAWTNIAIVNAVTGSGQQYTYVHSNPSKGINNYRILETDVEGYTSYTPVASIVNIPEVKQLTVYATPVNNGSLVIQLRQPAIVSLYAANSGLLAWQKNLPAGLQEIDVSRLNSGVYQLSASGESVRVMIQ